MDEAKFNQEKQPEPESQSVEKDIEEKDPELAMAKKSFADIFASTKDGAERVDTVRKRLGGIIDADIFDGKAIEKSLESCAQTEDEKQFVDGVMAALDPILVFRREHRHEFEQLTRKVVMEHARQDGMTPLNEVMYYGGRDNYVHIHLAQAKDVGVSKLRALVLDGLQKLAEQIKGNEQVQDIEATSWIVAKNPKLMEKLGFTVEGEVDEEFRRQHFSGDERKISRATIKREEFLKRYLKKER